MLDFSNVPFFDNHTHRIDVSNRTITPLDLGIAFMHGWGPVNPKDKPLGTSAEVPNCTPEYAVHVMNMPVVKVCVNLMAKRFGCEATPEAVVAERNKRTSVDGYGYAKALYEDGKIVGEMVDDGAPFGDPALNCFPTKIYRLFQMDPFVRSLIKECGSYEALKAAFDKGVRERLAEGFTGLKSHVLEIRSQAIRVIEDDEAAACYAKAQQGDKLAFEDVYLAIFEHVLVLTQELGFSVHVHTGCTGNPNDLQTNTDPFAIAPLMRDHRYYRGRIVFLHGNPPDFCHDAWVTHCYPRCANSMSALSIIFRRVCRFFSSRFMAIPSVKKILTVRSIRYCSANRPDGQYPVLLFRENSGARRRLSPPRRAASAACATGSSG